jgi:hypothetical protein
VLISLTARVARLGRRPGVWPAGLLLACCTAAANVPARADIYLCVDASGRRELTDMNRPGCKQIEASGAIPAPASHPAPAATPRAARPAPAPTVTPASFPRVDTAQQRVRDNDRREILNEELRNEERKLRELRREFNNGEPERQGNERNYAKYQERVAHMRDSIVRSEKNIEALRREISNIK